MSNENPKPNGLLARLAKAFSRGPRPTKHILPTVVTLDQNLLSQELRGDCFDFFVQFNYFVSPIGHSIPAQGFPGRYWTSELGVQGEIVYVPTRNYGQERTRFDLGKFRDYDVKDKLPVEWQKCDEKLYWLLRVIHDVYERDHSFFSAPPERKTTLVPVQMPAEDFIERYRPDVFGDMFKNGNANAK